jgi:putative hemolysin
VIDSMPVTTLAGLIVLAILLIMAGFFALSETALLTVTLVQARRMAEEKRPRANTLLRLIENRSSFLTTILLLTLVTNLTATSIASTLAYKYFQSLGSAAATAVMTLIIFIYCEVAPKTYAVNNAEKVALRVAYPIYWISKVFHPLVGLLTKLAGFSTRLIGIKTAAPGPYMTEEELLTAVEISEEEGVIKEDEKKLIHHIFEFGDTIVREVMTPRPDMISVSETATAGEALEIVMKEGHSRIPVFKESIDNVVGVLYARDLLTVLSKGKHETKVKALARDAIFVPETKRVAELLKDIQREKIHMAIVIDEYGSTAGLVTIEDLLEEIVGEIYDEYDLEEKQIEVLSPTEIMVDARLPIDDINEYFNVNLDYPEVDSVGGLVLELFGRLPKRGESVQAADLTFTVEKVTGKRISAARITHIIKTGKEEGSGNGD